VRLAIHAGGERQDAALRFDVGISYVTFAVAAALTRFVPRRWRAVALGAGITATAIQFAAEHDMTACGHALAYGVGLLCWPLLSRRGEPPTASPRVRRWAFAVLAVLAVIGLLAVYLPAATFGFHPGDAQTVTGSSWQGTVP
jgi:peptidoglycan/LPS O-acetylase OafA/YrhL